MLDQSFSVENFLKIFDLENRKGVFLDGRFFPDVAAVTYQLKDNSVELKVLRQTKDAMSQGAYEQAKTSLYAVRHELKSTKLLKLTKELEIVSQDLRTGNFQLPIVKVSLPKNKSAYKIVESPHSFFALKQINANLKRLYKIKLSNRFEIVSQLKTVLENDFPKVVIRTDIQKFYESIPQDVLKKKLNADNLLSFDSKKIVTKILNDFNSITGLTIGVPRGIAISAYLTELFMRDFDESVMNHPEIYFYARYVDDIIAVFSPAPTSEPGSYPAFLTEIAARSCLILNSSKTSVSNTSVSGNCTIDYLGYKIRFGKSFEIDISDAKYLKYRKKIETVFQSYKSRISYGEKTARKLLVQRIRFLTGNTKLLNNKRNVLVGVFYINSLISTSAKLKKLDSFLKYNISTLPTTSLQSRLLRYSFVDGFQQRRFSFFSTAQLKKIVEVWKNV